MLYCKWVQYDTGCPTRLGLGGINDYFVTSNRTPNQTQPRRIPCCKTIKKSIQDANDKRTANNPQDSSATIQLLMSFATLASQADGPISLLLRLGSILLCIANLATAVYSIFLAGRFSLILPGSFIVLWDFVYLILVSRHVRVVQPVTITFDLCSWFIAGIIGGMSIPFGFWSEMSCANGETAAECDDWIHGNRILIASCILAFLLTIVHFILFVRDIMVLRRQKRAVAKGIPLQHAPVLPT